MTCPGPSTIGNSFCNCLNDICYGIKAAGENGVGVCTTDDQKQSMLCKRYTTNMTYNRIHVDSQGNTQYYCGDIAGKCPTGQYCLSSAYADLLTSTGSCVDLTS